MGKNTQNAKKKKKKEGSSSGGQSPEIFFFFPLVFDTNISFNSSFTFTYDKTLSEGKDMSLCRKIRHPTIPSRWKLEANPCPRI